MRRLIICATHTYKLILFITGMQACERAVECALRGGKSVLVDRGNFDERQVINYYYYYYLLS